MYDRRRLHDALGAGTMLDADVAPPPALVPLLNALHSRVRAYVGGRRREGAPISRVLPEVKALVCAADPSVQPSQALAPLFDQVVRWTIAAYEELPPH